LWLFNLYNYTAVAYPALPGSLIPAIVIRRFGVKQSRVVLEQVST
jgi:hypothetical protein